MRRKRDSENWIRSGKKTCKRGKKPFKKSKANIGHPLL